MSEFTNIRLKLSKLLAKLSEVSTDKGVLTKSEDTEFVVGDAVYVTNEAGEYVPAPDAEYTLEDGTVYVVVSGMITEIKKPGLKNDISQASVELEETVESEPVDKAIEEIRKEINELYKIVDELVKKSEATSEVVEKMSKTSAAKPATDEIVEVSNPQSFKEIVNNAKKNFR